MQERELARKEYVAEKDFLEQLMIFKSEKKSLQQLGQERDNSAYIEVKRQRNEFKDLNARV